MGPRPGHVRVAPRALSCIPLRSATLLLTCYHPLPPAVQNSCNKELEVASKAFGLAPNTDVSNIQVRACDAVVVLSAPAGT